MYTITLTPDRPPHSCACCGGGSGRDWYLDLGEDVSSSEEMMSTIYLCSLCFIAAGKDVGIVPQGPLQDEIERLRVEAFDNKVKAEGLEHAIDDLFRARLFAAHDLSSSGLGHVLEVEQPGPSDEQSEGAGESSLHREPAQPGPVQDVGAVPNGVQLYGGRP